MVQKIGYTIKRHDNASSKEEVRHTCRVLAVYSQQAALTLSKVEETKPVVQEVQGQHDVMKHKVQTLKMISVKEEVLTSQSASNKVEVEQRAAAHPWAVKAKHLTSFFYLE